MRIEDEAWLRSQADRCRRLASSTTDPQTAATLKAMAVEYAQRAALFAAAPMIVAEPKAEAGGESNEEPKPPLED